MSVVVFCRFESVPPPTSSRFVPVFRRHPVYVEQPQREKVLFIIFNMKCCYNHVFTDIRFTLIQIKKRRLKFR